MTTPTEAECFQSGTLLITRKTLLIFCVLLYGSFALTTVKAATIVVPAGGDFQAALDASNFGDTIILQAGSTYVPMGDSFVLRNKGAGTGTDADYITIQTSGLSSLSAPGQRLEPALYGGSLAKITSTGGYAVLTADPGAHHYKFIGIEVATSGNPQIYTPDLINLGASFTRQQRLSTNHLIFDRMFIHAAELSSTNLFPSTVERTSGRGIAIGISEVWVINSYIAGFCGKYPVGTPSAGYNIDSYGVYSDAGPGPLHLVNNYIEAQFNNVFIGGSGMSTTNTASVSNPTLTSATLSNVANLAVGDLVAFSYAVCTATVTGNVYSQPWETGRVTAINGNSINFTIVQAQNSCAPAPPDNGGTARWKGDHIHDVEIRQNTLNKPDVWNAFSSPKAWIEIKELQNGTIDGNDMYSGVGTNIALTVRNQDGASPWSTIENVSVTNNRVRGYKWGFGMLLTDNEQPSSNGGNIQIRNNLFYQPRPASGSAANFVQLVRGHDITIEHNTIVQPGSPAVDDQVTPNFVFRSNIVANYQYGMQCTMGGGLSTCWPGLVMAGNVIIDTRWDKSGGSLSSIYPAGNYYPATPSDVGFQDLASDNYTLGAASPYRNLAADGTDPGVAMGALLAALGGSALPNPSPTPSPTPTPSPPPTASPTPTPTPTPGSASASFVQLDTSTQGNWKSNYGSDGYNVINDTVSYPAYAQVSPASQLPFVWASSTSAVQAVQKATSSDRIAACWYQSLSFSIDVNLADGQWHRMAVYALDWDAIGRTETIEIVDASNNALLDSRTLSGFSGGQYAVWNVQGHIKINVTKVVGTNSVISGLFFGGPVSSPTPTPTPTPTPSPTPNLGNSVGKAKRTGQNLSNQLASTNETTGSNGSNGSPLNQSAMIAMGEFVSEIQQAYAILNDERDVYPAAARIDVALQMAFNAATLANQAATQGDLAGVMSHLREAITNLELSDVLVTYGDVANPIDFASYMVRQHYVDFLNREPDQSGDDFWSNQITSCGTDASCVEVKRINVSAAFFLSIEFQETGYYVYRLYKSSYGRVPVLQEFLPDNASIASGVIVGADGWEARLAGSKQAFVQDWVQRADFQACYAGLKNEQYVDTLIANVGVTITSAERDGLVQDLGNGASRADVLAKLVENPTFTRAEFNSAFVLMQYFGYLGRDPDSAGFNFWLNKLNQFDGNFANAEMVKAFLESTEYRRRFGP